MRLPRDVSGDDLARRLGRLGYSITRQTGSHMRLTISSPNEHHLTVPRHEALRVGTLASILDDVGKQLEISRDEFSNVSSADPLSAENVAHWPMTGLNAAC